MPKKPDISRLIELQLLLLQFQAIERVTHVPGSFEPENDTEHSYNLALCAWFLVQYFPNLDRDKVIRFALVHDLVEIHAGDTYIFAEQTALDTKRQREHEALCKLEHDWPDFPDLIAEMKAYESHESEEAKFVYALDKIMPLLVIFLAEGYTFQKTGVTLDLLHENKHQKVAVSPEIKPYYDQLYELFRQRPHYFANPKSSNSSQSKLTIEAYDKYAETYDEVVTDFWRNFPKSILREFTEKLPGRKVLDLGSGSGRDAVLLRDTGLEVVCLDGSAKMVAMTRKLGFETHLSDFSQLDFPVESFDGVWAHTSIVHVEPDEARRIITRIHSLLKPGGLFMMGAISGGADGMVEHKTMPGAARYFKFYEPDELKQLITPLGFTFQFEKDYRPAHRLLYLNQIYRADKPNPTTTSQQR